MAASACRAALEAAGVKAGDIDALVFVGGIDQQPIPCTAALVQKELGEAFLGIPCFDVNATCLGFVTGLDTLSYPVAAGRYRRILLATGDLATPGLDWSQVESAGLFGDGAAAIVLGRTPVGGSARILGSRMETYASGASDCEILGGATGLPAASYDHGAQDGVDRRFLFKMDGKRVFRMASSLIEGFLGRLLEDAGVRMADIDLVIPHQASPAGLALLRKKLGIPESRFLTLVEDYGNLIATSIPLGLHVAIQEGRVQRGGRILLLGTSAGFSLGGVVLEY
jgi:3-oxoacyl-[acyl-carrier-protein] synthase-3